MKRKRRKKQEPWKQLDMVEVFLHFPGVAAFSLLHLDLATESKHCLCWSGQSACSSSLVSHLL